jgi:hypothetical protein
MHNEFCNWTINFAEVFTVSMTEAPALARALVSVRFGRGILLDYGNDWQRLNETNRDFRCQALLTSY